jgi:hypothetical protein
VCGAKMIIAFQGIRAQPAPGSTSSRVWSLEEGLGSGGRPRRWIALWP